MRRTNQRTGAQRLLRTGFAFFLCLILATPAAPSSPPKLVALTFDDGPTGALTLHLLEELERRQVPATFFLCGSRIAQMPDVVEAIAAGGHEIGVHCYEHTLLGHASACDVRKSIDETSRLIAQITGQEAKLFRPPGGVCTRAMTQVCEEELLPLILWSVDPQDWATRDASLITRRVLQRVKGGDIILMHDLRRSSVDAAIQIIESLQKQGYLFVTVSQLAESSGIFLSPGNTYTAFSNAGSTAADSRS